MRKKKKHGEEHMNEAWLLPYSDLMTLLLAVFIVLFAVSQVDETKAAAAAAAFRGIMSTGSAGSKTVIDAGEGILPEPNSGAMPEINPGVIDRPTTPNKANSQNQQQLDQPEKEVLDKTRAELMTYFGDQDISADVSMYIDERGLIISLDNAILFDSGSADLKPAVQQILIGVGDELIKLDNHIRVEGHTDNRPINSAAYPTNWELSVARSSRVVRLFIDQCGINPDKMVAVGYGEYKPIADNSTYEGRAQNRRVDIIVLNTRFNSLEEQLHNLPIIEP